MPAQLTRDRIIDALRDLPADAGVDEAIERLVSWPGSMPVFNYWIGRGCPE